MFEEMYHSPTKRPVATLALAAVAAFACAAGSQASGASTRIGSSIGRGAVSQQQILENSTSARGNGSTADIDVHRISDDAGAEQIFQPEFVSARAVAGFARNSQTIGTPDEAGQFRPQFAPRGNVLETAGPVDLRGDGLSQTILALQSGRESRTSANPVLAPNGVEDGVPSVSSYSYIDLAAQAAPPVGSANVLIPLPPSAWSGLIVMGGVSIAAGIRRIRRGRN